MDQNEIRHKMFGADSQYQTQTKSFH